MGREITNLPQLPKERGDRAERGDRGGKPGKGKPGAKGKRDEQGGRQFESRPPKKDRIDPDNPFAQALMGLRDKKP